MTFSVPDHVGAVITTVPGQCWRYIHDMERAGASAPCPEPVAWRGTAEFKASRGRRGRTVVVDSCDRHKYGLRDTERTS
jgi:hypothetical protein